jgi:hypothetical protein
MNLLSYEILGVWATSFGNLLYIQAYIITSAYEFYFLEVIPTVQQKSPTYLNTRDIYLPSIYNH